MKNYILESFSEFKNSLNESFKSTKLTALAKHKGALRLLKALDNKGIDLFNISDDNIVDMPANKAWKLKADNYLKFWFQAGTFAVVTIGNKRVDNHLNPTKSKYNRAGDYNFLQTTGKALKDLTNAFVIDLNELSNNVLYKDVLKVARMLSKKGATALISDSIIKKMNLNRYIDALKKSQFSDGSEMALIENATKYVSQLMATKSPLSVLVNPPSDSFYYTYVKDYAKELISYINEIEEASYDLEKVKDADYGRAASIKGNLQNILKRIKDYNTSALTNNTAADAMCKLMSGDNTNDYFEWLIDNAEDTADVSLYLNELKALNEWTDKNVPLIISKLKFSSIVELEMFADILYNIGRDYSNLNRSLYQMHALYERWLKAGGKTATKEAVFGDRDKERLVEKVLGNWDGVKKMKSTANVLKRKLEALKRITNIS